MDATALTCLEKMLLESSFTQKLNRFSPADFKAVFTTAYLKAVDSTLFTSTSNQNVKVMNVNIHEAHLLLALEQTKPSMSNKDRLLFENIYRRFQRNSDLAPSYTNGSKTMDISWSNDHSIEMEKILETAIR